MRRVVRGETKVTLSRLESRFLELLEQGGLELPETNRRAGIHFIDCRWPAWEQDRYREREARARGDEFRRYTWADIFEEAGPVLRELEPLLQGSIRPRRIA